MKSKTVINNYYREPDFPQDTPFEIKNLLMGLLIKKPTQRISSLEAAKEQNIYKDFLWDDLLKFRLKPFFVPYRDPRNNAANLTILTSPFQSFMEVRSSILILIL